MLLSYFEFVCGFILGLGVGFVNWCLVLDLFWFSFCACCAVDVGVGFYWCCLGF